MNWKFCHFKINECKPMWWYTYPLRIKIIFIHVNRHFISSPRRSFVQIIRYVDYLMQYDFFLIRVGRRFMVRMVCTLQIGIVFAIPFSSTLPMFATLRFFEGMFSLAFFQVYYTTGGWVCQVCGFTSTVQLTFYVTWVPLVAC